MGFNEDLSTMVGVVGGALASALVIGAAQNARKVYKFGQVLTTVAIYKARQELTEHSQIFNVMSRVVQSKYQDAQLRNLTQIISGIEQYSNPSINALFGASLMSSQRQMLISETVSKVKRESIMTQPNLVTSVRLEQQGNQVQSIAYRPDRVSSLQNICVDPCVNAGSIAKWKKALIVAGLIEFIKEAHDALRDGGITVKMLEEDEEDG